MLIFATFGLALASTPYAVDTFSRVVSDGWGDAESGGGYELTGNSSHYWVSGETGQILIPKSGNTRTATLLNAVGQDVDVLMRVQSDKPASGGPQEIYVVLRRASVGNEYRLGVRRSQNGSTRVRFLSVVDGKATQLGRNVPVPELSSASQDPFWIRVQATNANPTDLRIKVWPDGQPEPPVWLHGVTDGQAALQTGGAVGIRATLASSTSNAPVLLSFDDFQVATVDPAVTPEIPTNTLPVTGNFTGDRSLGPATSVLLVGLAGLIGGVLLRRKPAR
jgi:hypothetical protein